MTTFYNCTGLTAVEIPGSVSYIGSQAFSRNASSNPSSLTAVYYRADNPIEGEKNIFLSETYEKATLYVTKKGAEAARTTSPWMYFNKIEEYNFSGIDEITADFDDNSPYEVYTLDGVKIADSTDALPAGIYVIGQGSLTKKIAVN